MRVILAALAIVAPHCAPAAAEGGPPPVQAFVDVTVIRVYGEPALRHHTVIARGERIIAVGPSDRTYLPDDAVVLGQPGQIIAPGLADMHVHIFNPDDGILYLANGVTTVRNMSGRKDTNTLATNIDVGLTPGPKIYSSGPIIDGPGGIGGATATTPEEIRSLIEDEAREGYIAAKLYENLSPDVFVEGVRAARSRGLQVYAHVPFAMTLDQVLALRIDSVEHLTGFDRTLAPGSHSNWDEERWANADRRGMPRLAGMVARSGVWNDATLVALLEAPCAFADITAAEARPEYRYATPRQRALWRTQLDEVRMERDPQVGCAMSQRAHRTRLAMLRALVTAHAPLLIGTDAPQPFVYPGFSLQKELDFHLEAGLTRAQILRMASRDAARFLHRESDFGQIAEGARADILVLEGDPEAGFGALRDPAGVMAAGHWYDRATLKRLLSEVVARTGWHASP